MLIIYKYLAIILTPILKFHLYYRGNWGKEDKARLNERYGITETKKPNGELIHIHAASIGESQSALILIKMLQQEGRNFLITSGTVTSAEILKQRLPENAFHQYIPLDHPKWVKSFISHWKPNLIIFLESEIWPNLLQEINKQNIPAILLNARLSDESFERWSKFKKTAKKLLKIFSLIIAQSNKDKLRFELLGGNAAYSNNIKLNAEPLSFDSKELSKLQNAVGNRPLWVYASTHEGEEELAASLHRRLKKYIPNILTIIVPRHPHRGKELETKIKSLGTNVTRRGENKSLPNEGTDIYLCDTLGELGVFYSLSSIAMIGRSFSKDGGGGHNPVEAAQFDTMILTGPKIQFQRNLFDPMFNIGAAVQVQNEEELFQELKNLFEDKDYLEKRVSNAKEFIKTIDSNIEFIIEKIKPYLP
ncbi:MAG: 3-deoxy-D-manno-octulosonic acid transferase [Pseudomonadota bacterium]